MGEVMDSEKRPWCTVFLFTVAMSIATTIGTLISSYLLLSVKLKEETERAAVERRTKGTQIHCEKLQASAVLASQIDFSSDKGYPNSIHIADYIANAGKVLQNVPGRQIMAEELAFEKSASELLPFLLEPEAQILNRITLHHYVLTRLRGCEQVKCRNQGAVASMQMMSWLR